MCSRRWSLTATYNGQTVKINAFSQYVGRSIEITAEQAAKITTAIVVDPAGDGRPDGATRQVPTRLYQQDGKWYVVVSSISNSIYAFVSNTKTFTDTKGKWYESTANEMTSRMILSGIGNNQFAGDRDITRAGFAAIIIQALGLPSTGNGAEFTDVSRSAWYCGAIGTAYEYGLVSGIGNHQFAPDRKITRAETATLVLKLLQKAGLVYQRTPLTTV